MSMTCGFPIPDDCLRNLIRRVKELEHILRAIRMSSMELYYHTHWSDEQVVFWPVQVRVFRSIEKALEVQMGEITTCPDCGAEYQYFTHTPGDCIGRMVALVASYVEALKKVSAQVVHSGPTIRKTLDKVPARVEEMLKLWREAHPDGT